MPKSVADEPTDRRGTAPFSSRQWLLLLSVCGALLLEGMSLSSINIQAPLLANDLALSPAQLQVVVTSFLVVFAGGLLIAGPCADRFGRRRVFLLGITLFALGALVATLAVGPSTLVAGRLLQGGGSALSLPAAIAIVTSQFESGRQRQRALGVYSAMGAGGFSLGLVVGGSVTNLFGWRSGFAVYVPLALLVLAAAIRVVPTDRGTPPPKTISWWGAVLGTCALMLIVFALSGVTDPDGRTLAIALLCSGVLLAIVFVLLERRGVTALVDRQVARSVSLRLATIGLFAAFGAVAASLYLVNLASQDGLGYSPLAAGLAFLPQGAAVAFLSGVGSRAAGRWGERPVLIAGLLLEAAGLALFAALRADQPYWQIFLPASVLVGTGIAATFPAATALAVRDVPVELHGASSAIAVTGQQSGGAVGLALAGLVAGLVGTNTVVHLGALLVTVAYPLLGAVIIGISRNQRQQHTPRI